MKERARARDLEMAKAGGELDWGVKTDICTICSELCDMTGEGSDGGGEGAEMSNGS